MHPHRLHRRHAHDVRAELHLRLDRPEPARGVRQPLTFLRRSWDHDADPVAPAVVAEARAATAGREEPFSEADLEELLQARAPARSR